MKRHMARMGILQTSGGIPTFIPFCVQNTDLMVMDYRDCPDRFTAKACEVTCSRCKTELVSYPANTDFSEPYVAAITAYQHMTKAPPEGGEWWDLATGGFNASLSPSL